MRLPRLSLNCRNNPNSLCKVALSCLGGRLVHAILRVDLIGLVGFMGLRVTGLVVAGRAPFVAGEVLGGGGGAWQGGGHTLVLYVRPLDLGSLIGNPLIIRTFQFLSTRVLPKRSLHGCALSGA